MLEDRNYSFLKETYPVKYEIMQLRDLYGNTFADIAKEQGISVCRVIQDYHFIKIRQTRLYITHLAIVHGHTNTSHFYELYKQAETCYADWQCATAYLEKKYKHILSEYRAGEFGMPDDFLAQLPPFRKRWSKETVQKIIEWREAEKKSQRKTYIEIGRLLKMTKFKAESLYEWHYHEKFLLISKKLEEKYGEKQGRDISHYYYTRWHTAKRRYEMMCAEYPELIQ